MANERISFSETIKNHLVDEVDALCPICGAPLLPIKENKFRRIYEIAHIYPLNPTKEQSKITPHIQMLGLDINGFDNLLAVCSRCHTEYDKYFDIDEYNKWKNIKLSLQSKSNTKKLFSNFNIEEDIIDVIKSLASITSLDTLEQLNFKSLKIDEKMSETVPFIIKKQIKNDVVDYFYFVQNQFSDIDKEDPFIFDTISSQIKSFYKKSQREGLSQEEIYNAFSDWLNSRTGYKSKKACYIIIAFFIQDCEIYS